jgi:hypothetical protein
MFKGLRRFSFSPRIEPFPVWIQNGQEFAGDPRLMPPQATKTTRYIVRGEVFAEFDDQQQAVYFQSQVAKVIDSLRNA